MHLKKFSQTARELIKTEGIAVNNLAKRIDALFDAACALLFNCRGRIIVIGIGKSGHIGSKIAATFASTGSPAFFIHAAEANHGDLGMISTQDVILALSYSGETDELINILPTLKLLNIPFILLTGNLHSTLAQYATVCLDIGVEQEACPLGLAPTSSSTVMLVMGDALAIALLNARGFTTKDFAKFHPSGQLGRRLLLTVADVMHSGTQVPQVKSGTSVLDALLEISQKRLGMTTVTKNDKLLGIFTDGDLRRAIDQRLDLQFTRIDAVMSTDCKTIDAHQLATEALRHMEDNKITTLVITDNSHKPIGVIHIHDILAKGIK